MLQIVFVKWGTRYDARLVNRHVAAITANATCDLRFICITDNAEADLDPRIETRPFPKFAVPHEQLKPGCRLKLSMFKEGMLDPNVPAVFFDLDTLIQGDVNRMREHVLAKGGISIMPNHYIQWWPIQRQVRKVFPNKYYFGNSSMIGFMPRDYTFLFDQFNEEIIQPRPECDDGKKLTVDERFISYAARDTLRVFPNTLAVKFAEEYMLPIARLEAWRSKLPWVAKRRENLIAVTFVSDDLKPDKLIEMQNGTLVRYKKVCVRWAFPTYTQYWQEAKGVVRAA
jgi:hypothetical protein